MTHLLLIPAAIFAALSIWGFIVAARRKRVERFGDLRRQRIEDLRLPVGDWRWAGQFRHLPQFRYWCKCGTPLTDGPCGGAAVNAVCKTCRINYGCLDGYWGDQDKFEPLPPLPILPPKRMREIF